MNITNADSQILEEAIMLLPKGKEFEALSTSEQQKIINADMLLCKLIKKKKEQNKRTAEYIAERRKFDKNYARSRKEQK